MHKNLAFIFPGQGAQTPGMGKDFAEMYSVARHTFEEADDLLSRNLSKIIFDGPIDQLTETVNSQSGIFVTSIAILRTINLLFPDLKLSFASGLSLGEYTALVASSKLTFKDALSLVEKRGTWMSEACVKNPGTMAVIIGLDGNQVEEIVQNLNMPNDLFVANLNCPGQVVISGTLKGIEIASVKIKEMGARKIIPLAVQGAFHSGLMQSAENLLKEEILNAPFQQSPIQLVMNVSGSVVSDLGDLRHQLTKQVTSPVRWEKGILEMQKLGADLFIEMGPGKTLAGMNKRIGILAPTFSMDTVLEIEKFAGQQ